MCDSTGIHLFELDKFKPQNAGYKQASYPLRKMFKTKPYTTAKAVLTIFLKFEDQICCYYLETQRTTNGEYYRKKGGRKSGQQF